MFYFTLTFIVHEDTMEIKYTSTCSGNSGKNSKVSLMVIQFYVFDGLKLFKLLLFLI